jgi:hypothetical protein
MGRTGYPWRPTMAHAARARYAACRHAAEQYAASVRCYQQSRIADIGSMAALTAFGTAADDREGR